MKTVKCSAFLLLLFLFVGCSNIVVPKSPRESLAYSYASIDVLAKSILAAYTANEIDSDERHKYLDELDAAVSNLMHAERLLDAYDNTRNEGDKNEAMNRLSRAKTILIFLNSVLPQKKGGE